jgi:FkbM family methyltransferase
LLLEAYLQPGDTVIDVGANIGTMTLHAAALVGPRGLVVGIEPNPRVFRFLRENCESNCFRNVRLMNVAVGRQTATARLCAGDRDDFAYVNERGDGLAISIKRLDDLDIPNVPIALLKIDVEGYERSVLEGAADTLKRVACIYYEASDWCCARFGYSPAVLISLLKSSGFKSYKLESGGVLEEVGDEYKSPKGNANLVAVRDIDDFVRRTGFIVATGKLAK